MNERIRLLAEQAFFDDASSQPSDRMYTFSDHKMQKFAELIVRECQTVVEWAISVDSTIDRVPVLIKEHFGVE
jgi:hypothetical protein